MNTKLRPLLALILATIPFLHNAGAVEISYNTTETIPLGQALYFAAEGDELKAMASLMLDDEKHALGKESDLAYIYLADNFNRQGLTADAGRYYLQVANNSNAKQSLRDTAWLEYAKLKYERGEYDAALKAVRSIQKSLDDKQTSEAAMITARALLAAGKTKEAVDAIPGSIKNSSRWALYQRYNIGSLLLGEYNNKYGAAVLHTISEIDNEKQPDLAALKDQANLALGYSLLKISKGGKARSYLQQVRLNTLMSNLALLGMGWSYAIEQNYEKALVYWLELHGRPLTSAYSYEAALAIPYAFGQAGAYNQSISYYKAALNRFESDASTMNRAKLAINSPAFGALVSGASNDEFAWINGWKLDNEHPENIFISLFMDSPEFQLELKQYRALLSLSSYVAAIASDISDHETQSGAPQPLLRQQHEQLTRNIDLAINEKQGALQRLASGILERYQKQLIQYTQQARFGMAQTIEQATQKRGGE